MKGVDLSDGAARTDNRTKRRGLAASGCGRSATGPAGATPSVCSVAGSPKACVIARLVRTRVIRWAAWFRPDESSPVSATVERVRACRRMIQVKDLLPFRHVDVFSERPYAGNGLIVVFGGVENAADRLLAVAQELRQFETIFVEEPHDDVGVEARIFTVEEELPFAGHPVIGAAAALHERLASDEGERQWTFQIAGRSVAVTSSSHGDYFAATMNQGKPLVLRTVDGA